VPSLTYKTSLAFVQSSTYKTSLAFVPYSIPILVSSSSNDDIEDENPPFPAHLPPDESIEHEPALAPLLPTRVHSTPEVNGDIFYDPSNQRQTCSQFWQASSLLAQVSKTRDPNTFVEAYGHPNWNTTMNEEYCSLMVNDTWDLVPILKGRKLVRCKWVYRTKYASN
jgi:hypothetical protein